MIDNPTLKTLRTRRSIRNFTDEPVTDDQLEAILEAGRWAPSARNSQPWDFVVVRDADLRSQIGTALEKVTWAWRPLVAAPVLIVVSVDPRRDGYHYVEGGAVAAQNMCLAARSLGLGSAWAGIYGRGRFRRNAERAIGSLVSLPASHRVVAVIPIGVSRREGTSSRRPLAGMVHHDHYVPPERDATRPPAAAEDESRDLVTSPPERRSATEPGKFT